MSKIIYLNVGGKHFQTYQSTLTSGSEYFRAMLEGPWLENSAEKPVFIDRDPHHFEHILSYLRDPSYHLPPRLYYEADYYQIRRYQPEAERPTPYELVKDLPEQVPTIIRTGLRKTVKDLESDPKPKFFIKSIPTEDYKSFHQRPELITTMDKKTFNPPTARESYIKISNIGDWLSNFTVIYNYKPEQLDQFKTKYHLLEEICVYLGGFYLYSISGVGLYMYDQLFTPPGKFARDQILDLQTGELFFNLPQLIFPCLNHTQSIVVKTRLTEDISCDEPPLLQFNKSIYNDISLRGKFHNISEGHNIRGGLVPFPFTQFHYESNIRHHKIFANTGCKHRIPTHQYGCLTKLIIMVSDLSDFTKTYPIKSIKATTPDMTLIENQSERQILDRMADKSIYPDAFIYLIDMNPDPLMEQIGVCSMSISQYIELILDIELYSSPETDLQCHIMGQIFNTMYCHDNGIMGLRFT